MALVHMYNICAYQWRIYLGVLGDCSPSLHDILGSIKTGCFDMHKTINPLIFELCTISVIKQPIPSEGLHAPLPFQISFK